MSVEPGLPTELAEDDPELGSFQVTEANDNNGDETPFAPSPVNNALVSEGDDDDSEEDIDVNDLQTPDDPPPKVPNITTYYVELHKERGVDQYPDLQWGEIANLLRQEYREGLGKKAKQKINRRHKKEKQKFDRLLELYKSDHPEFDEQAYYAQSGMQDGDNETTGSGGGGGRRRKKRKTFRASGTGEKHDGQYVIATWGSDDEDDFFHSKVQAPAPKRRRTDKSSGGRRKKNNGGRDSSREKSVSPRKGADGGQLIDQIIHSATSQKKRGQKKDDFMVDDQVLAAMKKFVGEMKRAARLDWISNSEKKPCINMIRLLPRVIAELSKLGLHSQYIVHCDLLSALRDWVHPLPDGSLPPLRLRKSIYEIIQKLELEKFEELSSNLTDSQQKSQEEERFDPEEGPDLSRADSLLQEKQGFARTLMSVWGNPKETNENKTLLKKIMSPWIRSLSGATTSHAEMREELRSTGRQEVLERFQTLKKGTKVLMYGTGKRAMRPPRAVFDFAVAPSSRVDEGDIRDNGGRQKKTKHVAIDENFKKLSRTGLRQAVRPSITGRR